MFAYSQIEPNRLGTVSKWDIPINTWMGLKWEHGFESTMGRAISRMTEDSLDDGPQISPEDANAPWSIPGEGGLVFKEPVSAGRAQLMYERKRAELDRLHYLEAAKHNAISFKGVAGFGAALVGGLSHPLDLGISFIPLFGQSARAGQMAKLGAGAFRQRLARGLIATEDDLVRAGVPMPRISASIMEGMVGNAIAEVPVFIQNTRDQAIYGFEDSVINVLAGGAFAGAVRSLGRALEQAGELYLRLDERIRHAADTKAQIDFLESRPIDVDAIVRVDEAAIRERVKFDDAAAAREAEAELGQASDWTVTVQAPQKLPDGTEVPGYVVIDINGGKANLRSTNPEALRKEGFTVPDFSSLPQGRYKFDEAVAKLDERDALQRELVEELGDDVAAKPKLDVERERRINELVEAKRKEWNEEERFKKAVAAEISRQQSQGKILPDEEVQRLTFKEAPEEADIAAIKEDSATLEKELAVMDPEGKLAEGVKTELGKLKSYEKAVDAALPCIIQSLIADA